MKLEYISFGFGILFSVTGIGYLATEYVKYLSEVWKLIALLLTKGPFFFLGKYLTSLGW